MSEEPMSDNPSEAFDIGTLGPHFAPSPVDFGVLIVQNQDRTNYVLLIISSVNGKFAFMLQSDLASRAGDILKGAAVEADRRNPPKIVVPGLDLRNFNPNSLRER